MPSWDVLLGWGVDNVALHRAEGISRPEVHGVLSAGHGEKTVASCSGLGGEGSEARRKWEADGGKGAAARVLSCRGTWGSKWVGRSGLSAPSQGLMV